MPETQTNYFENDQPWLFLWTSRSIILQGRENHADLTEDWRHTIKQEDNEQLQAQAWGVHHGGMTT